MPDLTIEPIERISADRWEALLDLNNAHAIETSELTLHRLRAMVGIAFSATAINEAALLITFDQDADYDSENFLWFRERFDRFVYVDRIIVSKTLRGMGAARALYMDLFEHATSAGHGRIVCEVNRVPPNPGSDAFHEKLDFKEIGQAELSSKGKTVRYLERSIVPA